MAKRFKLKFPSVIQSFRFCRFKNSSSLPKNPTPAINRLSPINPKSFDISFPALPAPPPTTPECPPTRNRGGSSKSKPNRCVCRSRSSNQFFFSDCSIELPCYSRETPSFAITEKYYVQKKSKEKNRARNFRRSVSSGKGGWLSNEEEDEDSEALIDSSISFSSEYPCEFSPPNDESRRKEKKVKRLKRVASKERKGSWTAEDQSPSPVKESVLRRMTGCATEGKVKESVAVVKKSEDPYEDFKRSMLEMIMEKQIFEARDLEELLQCFLTLNSRQYHGVIVEAFSEIWEILFCDSTVRRRVSFGL
ncbi:hypothetical protein UlMin_034280 [Ulmus minor]